MEQGMWKGAPPASPQLSYSMAQPQQGRLVGWIGNKMKKTKWIVSKILSVEVIAKDASEALEQGGEMMHNGGTADHCAHITLDWQVEEVRKGAKIAHTSLKL